MPDTLKKIELSTAENDKMVGVESLDGEMEAILAVRDMHIWNMFEITSPGWIKDDPEHMKYICENYIFFGRIRIKDSDGTHFEDIVLSEIKDKKTTQTILSDAYNQAREMSAGKRVMIAGVDQKEIASEKLNLLLQ